MVWYSIWLSQGERKISELLGELPPSLPPALPLVLPVGQKQGPSTDGYNKAYHHYLPAQTSSWSASVFCE